MTHDNPTRNAGASEFVTIDREKLRVLIRSAGVLLQNSRACVEIHYGLALVGEPGWLADCAKAIEEAQAMLASAPSPEPVEGRSASEAFKELEALLKASLSLGSEGSLQRLFDACTRARRFLESAALLSVPVSGGGDFQDRVRVWLLECFGQEISDDTTERNHRFLEESLELVQALGCTRSEAHQLVDYTFSRPVGNAPQEVCGVVVTLSALCSAAGISMLGEAETELCRIWGKIDTIRAKQAAKPKHSPLPERPSPPAPDTGEIGKGLLEAKRSLERSKGYFTSDEEWFGFLQLKEIFRRMDAAATRLAELERAGEERK